MSNKPLASQYDASQRCARLHGHSRPEYRGYCFFSGAAGVTGCEPPVDFGPVVTSALLSVEPLESLAAVVLVFGLAPLVGPLPASFVDVSTARWTAARVDFRLGRRGRRAER